MFLQVFCKTTLFGGHIPTDPTYLDSRARAMGLDSALPKYPARQSPSWSWMSNRRGQRAVPTVERRAINCQRNKLRNVLVPKNCQVQSNF